MMNSFRAAMNKKISLYVVSEIKQKEMESRIAAQDSKQDTVKDFDFKHPNKIRVRKGYEKMSSSQ